MVLDTEILVAMIPVVYALQSAPSKLRTSMTEIIHKALLRYDKENAKASQERTKRILEIGRRCAAVPDKVPGTMDDIIGYDEFGAL